jgi:hypothetical protein
MTWFEEAACRGMTGFHPPTGATESPRVRRARVKAAITVCATCPVIDVCRQHVEPFGVWAGVDHGHDLPRPTGPGRVPTRHGTDGGYNSHRRRGEKACVDCLRAHNRTEIEAKVRRRLQHTARTEWAELLLSLDLTVMRARRAATYTESLHLRAEAPADTYESDVA